MRWFSLWGRALKDRRGASAVEFAMIAPVLATALLGTVDLGVGLYERMEVENAAQAGAQYAIAKGWDQVSVSTAVSNASSMASISATPAPTQSCGCANGTAIVGIACGSNCPNGAAAGTYVTVNAQVQYSTIMTWPGLSSPVTLTAQSVVRLQ